MSLCLSSGASALHGTTQVQAGQTLFSKTSAYSVLRFIGEGSFGNVAKCRNLITKEMVAVKILKTGTDFTQVTEKEVSMLKIISALNPDHVNVVKFFEWFEHMGQMCLAFEMLDKNLHDLLCEQSWKPLSLMEIRPIAKQLMVALDALKGLGIIHTDIKPDNVMFVNVQNQPLRVKLIDFGGAIQASKVQPREVFQPTGYRAPEVALGLPVTEAIDVWGLGCVLAFLYLAENFFPVNCDYQMMKSMVEVLGLPEERLLRAGEYTQNFFIEEKAAAGLTWRLMTPEEYAAANKVIPGKRTVFTKQPMSLDGLMFIYPESDAEFENRRAFVHLMKQLLHLDGDQRISPSKALHHPFITTSHLIDQPDSKANLAMSRRMMNISSVEGSAHRVFFDSSPITGSSDGVSSRRFYDKYPAFWSFDGGLCFCCCNQDPAPWSSNEAEPKDSIASASSANKKTHAKKKRTGRFFSKFTATVCCCCGPTVED